MQRNRIGRYDVIVAGGGIAGVLAAVAVAKNGVKVMLIESQNCLGGTKTASGVDTFYGYFTPGDNPKKVVGVVEKIKCSY